MKIAIEGNIIDTKDIYKISPIQDDEGIPSVVGFTLYFFNNHSYYVYLDHTLYLKNRNLYSYKNYDVMIKYNASIKDLREHSDYKECIIKLTKIRDAIIKIWSENQSEIPQFNLE